MIAAVSVTQFAPKILSLPALLSSFGLNEVYGRMFATSLVSAALIIFAFSHGRFRRSFGQIAAGMSKTNHLACVGPEQIAREQC